ncbi:hypothetical protein SporoP8_01905 [Sporosarcina ureae]|uniref:hypothetical protein n=1 Tax=Sporosarcina ureae TaxID=1571 RepID=UPI000A14D360|nr:hypothetical protein [Sporosarcina ureae]ARJ37746.1 hypothetical protein SporoP8_01905 [Sporosarcina ureae]
MKKKLSVFLIVFLLTVGGSTSALSTYTNYSVVVPKFNGTAFTGTQYKNGNGTPLDLKVTVLGKAVDARSYGSGGAGGWVRITKLGSYSIPDPKNSKGDYSSVQFSNDLATYVDVAVVGSFRNN